MTKTWFRSRPSRRLQEEVEAEAGEAGDQEQGVGAQVAGLGPADPGAGPADQVDDRDHQSLDDVALEDRVGPAPDGERGPDGQQVDRLVEVPLVLEEVVRPGKTPLKGRRP